MARTDISPLAATGPAAETATLPETAVRVGTSWRSRLIERVQSRRGGWTVAAIGCALALPSLALGLTTDDRLNVYKVQHGSGPFTMFAFSPERIEHSRQIGALSWWTNPKLAVDFLRPLSAMLPDSMLQLYGGSSSLAVKRIDAQTLEVAAAPGWGDKPAERVFASLASLPRAGEEQTVASVRIRVLESDPAGRPRRVQFRFTDALESKERLWLSWRGQRPEPWNPPVIGGETRLPALNPFASLPAF